MKKETGGIFSYHDKNKKVINDKSYASEINNSYIYNKNNISVNSSNIKGLNSKGEKSNFQNSNYSNHSAKIKEKNKYTKNSLNSSSYLSSTNELREKSLNNKKVRELQLQQKNKNSTVSNNYINETYSNNNYRNKSYTGGNTSPNHYININKSNNYENNFHSKVNLYSPNAKRILNNDYLNDRIRSKNKIYNIDYGSELNNSKLKGSNKKITSTNISNPKLVANEKHTNINNNQKVIPMNINNIEYEPKSNKEVDSIYTNYKKIKQNFPKDNSYITFEKRERESPKVTETKKNDISNRYSNISTNKKIIYPYHELTNSQNKKNITKDSLTSFIKISTDYDHSLIENNQPTQLYKGSIISENSYQNKSDKNFSKETTDTMKLKLTSTHSSGAANGSLDEIMSLFNKKIEIEEVHLVSVNILQNSKKVIREQENIPERRNVYSTVTEVEEVEI